MPELKKKKKYHIMRIIHFSDVHLRPHGLGTRTLGLYRRMSEKLHEIHKEGNIDLIVFSGDMIDKGGKDYKGQSLYDCFKTFEEKIIKPIVERLGIGYHQFIFVPGNHDIKRDAINHDIIDGLKNERSVDDLLSAGQELPQMEDFNRFSTEYYDSHRIEGMAVKRSVQQMTVCFPISGHKVGITMLNSAWMCEGDSDYGNIFLGTCQLNTSQLEMDTEECDVRIAVSHHHYSFMNDSEKNKIRIILHKHYGLYLTGHTHGKKTEHVADEAGDIFQSVAAGNLYDNMHETDDEYKNGFTVLDYDPIGKSLKVTPYIQQPDESFDIDRNYGAQGTLTLVKHTPQMFQSLDIWLKTYRSPYDIIENDTLKELREQLRDGNNRRILLSALSGLGKTRLVHDAFCDGTIHTHSYYTELNSDNTTQLFYDFTETLKAIGHNEGLIIVDNCSSDILNNLNNQCPTNIRLICVNNEYYDEYGSPSFTTVRMDPQMLKTEVGLEIERKLNVDDHNRHICDEIKKLADGFPYMAYQLLDAYRESGSVNIAATTPLMERLIKYSSSRKEEERASMMTMSLFQPFPLAMANETAFEFIVNNDIMMPLGTTRPLRKRAINTTIARFSSTLIERTASWVNIRPFPLAVYLAKEWFTGLDETDISNLLADFEKLREDDPGTHMILCNSMAKRIEYMRGMPLASEFVDRLMGVPAAPFANEKVACSDMGSRLFLAMASVNPVAVSDCIYRIFAFKSKDWIDKEINERARRNLVRTLEKLCFDPESFSNAATVMAKFMMAENEEWANNSTRQFQQLFHIMLPGTEADLGKRMEVIVNLYDSGHIPAALTAIDSAFISSGFVRVGGAERFGSERKKDYTPTYEEIWKYWYGCRDILIRCVNEHNRTVPDIVKIITKHTFHWIRDGYFNTLFKPLVDCTLPYDPDLAELHEEIIHFTAEMLIKRYPAEKQHEITEYINSLKPQNFSFLLREAKADIYNSSRSDYFRLGLEIMEPLVSKFLESGIYRNTDELERLVSDSEYVDHTFFHRLEEQVSDSQLDELFDNCLIIVKKLDADATTPFLISLCRATKSRKPSSAFREKLLDAGLHTSYILYSAICEDENLTLLKKLITQDKAHLLHTDMLSLYLGTVTVETPEAFHRMLDILHREYSTRTIELVGAILRLRFAWKGLSSCSKELIESILLEYPLDERNTRLNTEYASFITDLLEKKDCPEFALKLNDKLIKGLNDSYLYGSLNGVYSTLLTQYTDIVWPSFEEAFISDDYMEFTGHVWNELGSGIGFGAGPLFQIGDDRIKEMCLKHPEIAPAKIAGLMPIYDAPIGQGDSFGRLMLWILDNFGEQKDVLSNIHSNIHTFGWTGFTIGLFAHHRKCMEKLLNHKKQEVREWASRCINEFNQEIQTEQNREDFIRMHYDQ